MNGRPLSDTQISRALREHLPTQAYPGLYGRIATAVESTPQRRSLRSLFGIPAGADAAANRRMLLLLAALLLALMLGSVAVVGALLEERLRDPTRDLSVEPPADVAAFARSAYEAMPNLPPLTLTALEDGGVKKRIYVHSSGAVRIETFASSEATEPETYEILAGTQMGRLVVVDAEPAWYEQRGAISEDPRVFVYAQLGAANFGATSEPGCETAISPGEVHSTAPASAWEYVGVEYVAGRPTHHIRCVGELWIDVELRLTMRSRGAVLGQDGRPVGDRFHTIEVTEIEFGDPPDELFEIEAPPGVARISEEEYGCAMDPYCSASPRPLITPPPAPDQLAPRDVDALVGFSEDAFDDLPAFEAFIERSNTKYPGSQLRVFYDGSGRFRLEDTSQVGTVWESTTVTLAGDDYYYVSEVRPDGSTFWRDRRRRGERGETGPIYPLSIFDSCAAGWLHVRVDLVAGRRAHHVSCPGSAMGEFWIDDETGLGVRSQSLPHEMWGTEIQEVTELRFVDQPADLFELPEGVVP